MDGRPERQPLLPARPGASALEAVEKRLRLRHGPRHRCSVLGQISLGFADAALHLGMVKPELIPQLPLGQPSLLSKGHNLLLPFHFTNEIVHGVRKGRVGLELAVDPSHEGCLPHRRVSCRVRAATRRMTSV